MSEATAVASEAGCPFCKMVMERVMTGEGIETIGASGVYHFEPLNPVTPGHRLFVPAFHYEDAAEAPSATGAVFEWAAWWAAQQGEDFNLIVNAGPHASQTVRHLHVHYVPRREDDGLILPWTPVALAEQDTGEPEWEYGIEYSPGYEEFEGRSRGHHEQQVARIRANGGPYAKTARVIRRIVAGPSEPVPVNQEGTGR